MDVYDRESCGVAAATWGVVTDCCGSAHCADCDSAMQVERPTAAGDWLRRLSMHLSVRRGLLVAVTGLIYYYLFLMTLPIPYPITNN